MRAGRGLPGPGQRVRARGPRRLHRRRPGVRLRRSPSGSCCAACRTPTRCRSWPSSRRGCSTRAIARIGPMGFGGATTLLGVKIGVLDRLPASLLRVGQLHVLGRPAGRRARRRRGGADMADLNLPMDEATIRGLRVGDFLELTGSMITGRDAAHKWLVEAFREEVAPYLEGCVIYHCGPVVRKNDGRLVRFVAAGPTTSIARGALPGRRRRPLRAARRHRQGGHGAEDPGRPGRGRRASTSTPSAARRRCSPAACRGWRGCSCSRSSASPRRCG